MKSISYNKRKYDYKNRTQVTFTVEPHVINKNVQELDPDLQRPIIKVKFVTRKDNDLSVYKVSDFYLENLKMSGAIDNLKNVSLSRDNLGAATHVTNVVNQIINSENQ